MIANDRIPVYLSKKSTIGSGNIQVSFPEELGFALKMQQPELAVSNAAN